MLWAKKLSILKFRLWFVRHMFSAISCLIIDWTLFFFEEVDWTLLLKKKRIIDWTFPSNIKRTWKIAIFNFTWTSNINIWPIYLIRWGMLPTVALTVVAKHPLNYWATLLFFLNWLPVYRLCKLNIKHFFFFFFC